eukprot:g1184.t1
MDASDLLSSLDGPSLDDLDDESSILEWVEAFVKSDNFNVDLADFIGRHVHQFAGVIEVAEHRLEWHELYQEFLLLSETKIENFLEAKGYSSVDFQRACEAEIERCKHNYRHSRRSFFIQLLLACTEYEQFLKMMVRVSNPKLEPLNDLHMAATNMLETARVADLPAGARGTLEEEAEAALDWVAAARMDAGVTALEVEAREEAFERVCHPIIDAKLRSQEDGGGDGESKGERGEDHDAARRRDSSDSVESAGRRHK